MPVVSRKTLRLALGQSYLRDTITGNTALSLGTTTPIALTVLDSRQANLAYSGQNLYDSAFVRVASTDYLVASFNAGSGAFVSQQIVFVAVASGTDYELSNRVSAADKDLMLDDTIQKIRIKQEVPLQSTQDAMFYSIEGVASPHYVSRVLDAYYFANPSSSLARDLHRFKDLRVVMTGSGRELRVNPALGGSNQIIIEAILAPTLGSGDAATLNIPDMRWVLAGATARCYDLIIQTAPGQNEGNLAKRRAEWGGEFTRLTGRFAPLYDQKIRFGDPGE